MIRTKHFKYLPFLFLIIFISISAKSQNRISSPYSYYGLGEIQLNHSGYIEGMGGIKNAVRNPAYINVGNPASYSAIDTNSFIFDLGVTSNSTQLKSNVVSQNYTNHTSLSYLLFGFPVARWCGLSLGILPYSKTGYKIITEDTIKNMAGPDNKVTEQFEGTGGINQAYLGAGFRIFKNFSLGVNVGYLFGTTYKTRSLYTPDQSYSYNIRTIDDIAVSSFYFNYGLQYQLNLKKKYDLIFGARFNLPMNLNAKRSQLAQRYTASGEIESVKDTTIDISDEKGKIYMPLLIGGGIAFSQKNKWLVGVDFDWQNWKKFKSFNVNDSVNNSFNIAAGGEIIPKYTSVGKYWKKISYRFGFHYGQTYLELNGAKINDYSFSIGLGFPISKIGTMINISAEAGKKGKIQTGLIQENYIKFTLGFSFREFWFYRPKLN
jgi:long-subunit fatty acid transport protein